MREIVLDTETTGLDPKDGHRIIEIAALEMEDKMLTGNKLHFYVNPEREMPSDAYRIHGISGEFLKDKPIFTSIADDFLKFIRNNKLVIHNAVFDINFINYELTLLNKPNIEFSRALDTLSLAKKMFPGCKVNLDALCKRFKIDNSDRKFHGALKDSILLAQVYLELTGGRQKSFNMNNLQQSKNHSYTLRNLSSKKITVIKPSTSEIKNHKDLLMHIPNNLWSKE